MSRFGFALIVAVFGLHACRSPTDVSVHERADSLVGVWTVVSGSFRGNEYRQGRPVGRDGVLAPVSWTWTFTPEEYSWRVETHEGLAIGRLGERAYLSDPTKQPMELDLAVPAAYGPDEIIPGEFMSCIYKIEGETLTVSKGSPRPRSFGKAGERLVLKRQ